MQRAATAEVLAGADGAAERDDIRLQQTLEDLLAKRPFGVGGDLSCSTKLRQPPKPVLLDDMQQFVGVLALGQQSQVQGLGCKALELERALLFGQVIFTKLAPWTTWNRIVHTRSSTKEAQNLDMSLLCTEVLILQPRTNNTPKR